MSTTHTTPLDVAVAAYIECALWSSTDGDDQLDSNYGLEDIAPETLDAMRADVVAFLDDNNRDLRDLDRAQVGHDFWLTRNHHGAGFWDRGLGAIGDRLTVAAHLFGECDLYVGDDGQVYAA